MPRPSWHSALAAFLNAGQAVGLVLLGLVMVIVMGVGVYKVAAATVWMLRPDANGVTEPMVAATQYLKGLEFMFLAPLGFLTFKAIVHYVIAQVRSEKPAEADAHAAELNHLKEFIVGLIAAIVATDLVTKVLMNSTPPRFEDLSGELAVLVVTVAYLWILRQPHHAPGAPHH